MTPQFDGPIPISTSISNFGWLLKRRETAVFSSPRPQPIHGGIHRAAAGHLGMVTACPDRFHTRLPHGAPCLHRLLTPQPVARGRFSEVRAADSGEGQRGRWALALSTGPQAIFKDAFSAAGACPGRRSQATPAAKATLTARLGGCQRLARWRQGCKLKTAASSGYPRRCPPRI
eukprot:scaffold17783_cov68-Phaeocystis_antarctica.AAC.3